MGESWDENSEVTITSHINRFFLRTYANVPSALVKKMKPDKGYRIFRNLKVILRYWALKMLSD